MAKSTQKDNAEVAEVAKPPVKMVENPVLIAAQIVRQHGKADEHGKFKGSTTTFDATIIVAAADAGTVVADLNGRLTPPREGSKTTRKYVVMATTGKNAVPVIENAADFAAQKERQTKRDALAKIPDGLRASLGLPSSDDDDSVIDAWTPNATATVTATK